MLGQCKYVIVTIGGGFTRIKSRGGGGVLLYFHIYGSDQIMGFKNLNFNIFGGFRKRNIFGGMMKLWIFVRGHHKTGLFLEVISIHLRAWYRIGIFSGDQGTELVFFFGC